MFDSKGSNFRTNASICKRVRNAMKRNALGRKRNLKQQSTGCRRDAGRLNALFPNKKYALEQDNVKRKRKRERGRGALTLKITAEI